MCISKINNFFRFRICISFLHILYYFLARAEYSAFWKCVQAGGAYMFTQLCKMMILATFFPASEMPVGGFDVTGVSVITYLI